MITFNGIDELDLIKGIQNGDQTAFDIIFRYYYPGLVVFASQIVQDKDEATEIVQDFFVRLWEKRSNLKESESLKSYFFSSVKNRSLNYLKHVKVKDKVIERLKVLTADNLIYNPDLYIHSELQEKIKKALEKLPPRCKEVFVLSRLQGLSNDEIAGELNISKRTVETQISNALKVMRHELQEYVGLAFLLGFLKF